MTSYDGTVTQYAYDSRLEPGDRRTRSTSIQYADGSQHNFTYDSVGRLAGTSQAGGADPVTYSYNVGDVTVTDAAGDATQYYLRSERACWSRSSTRSATSPSRPTTPTST